MDTILAKLASFMDTVIVYRIDFDEIDGKINLIYQLLSPSTTVACNA